MTARTIQMLKAFIRLTDTEQKEFYLLAKQYVEAIDMVKKYDLRDKILNEAKENMVNSLGCPICERV